MTFFIRFINNNKYVCWNHIFQSYRMKQIVKNNFTLIESETFWMLHYLSLVIHVLIKYFVLYFAIMWWEHISDFLCTILCRPPIKIMPLISSIHFDTFSLNSSWLHFSKIHKKATPIKQILFTCHSIVQQFQFLYCDPQANSKAPPVVSLVSLFSTEVKFEVKCCCCVLSFQTYLLLRAIVPNVFAIACYCSKNFAIVCRCSKRIWLSQCLHRCQVHHVFQ